MVIADSNKGRVDFIIKNGFAYRGYTILIKKGGTVEESFSIGKETVIKVGKV